MKWFVLSLLLVACGSPAKQEIVVAAASDLTNALPELASAFTAKSRVTITPTLGASKQLATQINQGAPFEVFMSANTKFVDDVVKSGKCDGATKQVYARGHLALWVKADFANPPKKLEDLTDRRFAHIAIANPETAPYGAAAKAALEKAGVWSQVEGRVVHGENIRETLKFGESGNAEVAIVSRSLAIGSRGSWVDVDDGLHPPIEQALVVCGNGEASRAFANFVMSAEGQGILARWGLAK